MEKKIKQQVRYILDEKMQYAFYDIEFNDRIYLNIIKDKHIFVNIIEWNDDKHYVKVKLILPNGAVYDNVYLPTFLDPIKLLNQRELFDGRFNI